jgi:hypothetical protein
MCWSSAFDPFEGSTLGSKSVPGGRTDRSREPSRARAVRRLGVPVGMGGKANCLCLRGIWETPKPRYREETKPVVKLPGTTFVPKIPLATPGRGARYRGTETAGPSAKRGDSLAPRGTSEFREVSRPRGACSVTVAVCASVRVSLSRPGRDRLAAAALPGRERAALGRHHRLPDDAPGSACWRRSMQDKRPYAREAQNSRGEPPRMPCLGRP